MGDWVHVGHSSREFEVVGMGSNMFFNLVGSEIAVCKFLRWPGGVDVSGVQVHHVSNVPILPLPGLMPSGPRTH
jgi:hypothetical protein